MPLRARMRGLVCIGALSVASTPLAAQRPAAGVVREAPPQGQRVEAQDGDVVVVENDARVSIVRRQLATLRVIVDQSKATAIVLADYAFGPRASDGVVDRSWRFDLASGTWPIEPRWEGQGAIEESLAFGGFLPPSLAFDLPQGRIGFVQAAASPPDPEGFLAIMAYKSSGAGGGGQLSFDEAERSAMTAPANSRSFGPGAIPGAAPRPRGTMMDSGVAAPVRPGGNIPMPRKIRHVDPVTPEAARAARVLGIVILELTIDAGGAVQDTRVLRSIPLLDDAAIAAARQWLYEPTLVNGQAVLAIITATVEFKMQ